MKNRYTPFFAAYNASVHAGNYATKEEVVCNFTNGKYISVKDLTDEQLAQLTANLNKLTGAAPPNDKADKMRKSIIAIFHRMKKTPADAIAWAERQGVKGTKKRFNDYTTQELYTLIRVAEEIEKSQQKVIRKQILKAPF